jgi:D-alanine-D-alanine ligase
MPLRVVVLFNSKDRAPHAEGGGACGSKCGVDDLKAELDTMDTVHVYSTFIRALGHEVIEVHGDEHMLAELRALAQVRPVDICWNTCEGYRGLDREAQVPALLEMAGVPYTFARPMTMAITLDKAMTKRVLAYHGIPTPAFQEFQRPDEPLCAALAGKWPLFVKPNAEGTGMGITAKSLVRSEAELRDRLGFMLGAYGQTALVEEFVPGRDVTCGVVGNVGKALYVTAINEVDYEHTKVPDDMKHVQQRDEMFYCRSIKALTGADFQTICPAQLPDEVTREIQRLTAETFRVCQARDGARIDFRIDTRGGKL